MVLLPTPLRVRKLVFTGIPQLDRLTEGVPSHWVVEFYGDWKVVNALLHRAAVLNSGNGLVIALTQEFGGLNPYLINRLAKAFGMTTDNIFVARAFKLEDTVELLKELRNSPVMTVFVVDPYLHTPQKPSGYWRASKITALIRTLVEKHRKEVTVFNRISKFGKYLPEGGSFHHHTVHVMIRLTLTASNRWVRAEIVKHPIRPWTEVKFPKKYLTTPEAPAHTLAEWIPIR